MKQASLAWGNQGFTLVELLVTVSIIGILLGIAVPIANVYRAKAEYSSVLATLRYLMDGEETYLLENDAFYPEGFGVVSVGRGEEKAIPELKYTFPAGHKHS
jgi:prepilin-type N-terminal cleavage/methylation domain-containing protein